MNNNDLTEQQIKAILKLLENAINQGPWEGSNFLKVIGKSLHDFHSKLATHLDSAEQLKNKPSHVGSKSPNQNQQEVFISLYTTEGNNIQAWERILINLPRHMISRPIYENEEDVKNLVKSKENKLNEAYVSIFVDKSYILSVPPDRAPRDKFGKVLLTLRDKSLDLNHVNYFVHLSGTYHYIRGRLIMAA